MASEDDPPGRIKAVSLHVRSTEERRSTSRRRRLTTRALADFGGALTGNLSPFAYDSCVVSERSLARSAAHLRFAPNRLRLRSLARPLTRRVHCAALHCHALSIARVRPRGAGEPLASLNARPYSFAAVRLSSASLRLVSRLLARKTAHSSRSALSDRLPRSAHSQPRFARRS